MTSRRSAVLRRLPVACALGVALAAAASVWLDRSADRARQLERIRLWGRVVAQVAADRTSAPAAGGDPSFRTLLSAVVRTDPDVAAVRVEAADGLVLGQAGDTARAEAWEDRTFPLTSGPVRVRLGYRLGVQPLALAVRGAFWALLVGSVLALVLVTAAWSLRDP